MFVLWCTEIFSITDLSVLHLSAEFHHAHKVKAAENTKINLGAALNGT
jgi:hypothetical protein